MALLALSGSARESLADTPDEPNMAGAAVFPPQQADGIGPEMDTSEAVHLFWHRAVTNTTSLGTNDISTAALSLSAEAATDASQIAQAFLRAYQAPLQIATGEAYQWQPIRTEIDKQGNSHVVMQQLYHNLPVFAGEVIVHLGKGNSAITAANGEYLPAIRVSPEPALSVEEAYKAATYNLPLWNHFLTEQQLLIYNPALLAGGAGVNHLAYRLVAQKLDAPDSETVF
ncbi:MAG: hypothetical protein D6768_19335, partial [Chloroflexi bacterium]